MLFDGSPFHPQPQVLFDYAQQERFTLFGTSAKYIDACKKAGLRPRDTHDLASVRLIASTGSPLAPESFEYVYDAIKPDVHLASVSGGTDIVSCFVLGDPTGPVWKGEIQAPGLGMAVDVWDDEGQAGAPAEGRARLHEGVPLHAVMFWNDPDGAKYRAAYFERFPGVWCHGDFAEWTEHGGLVIHGRSDATLNPGGVRIGTAEIYAQVEQIPEVLEALAIGQDWDGDVRVVLFVRLREGVVLDDALQARIRTKIRTGASPRHVPARIVAVADIPAHQVRQDHRACGARRRAWARGEEQGGAGQPRGARPLSGTCRELQGADARAAAASDAARRPARRLAARVAGTQPHHQDDGHEPDERRWRARPARLPRTRRARRWRRPRSPACPR